MVEYNGQTCDNFSHGIVDSYIIWDILGSCCICGMRVVRASLMC